MKHRFPVILVLVLFATISLSAQGINIGVLSDFPADDARLAKIKSRLQSEIQKTVGASKQVLIDSKNVRGANWDLQTAQENYMDLNKKCDLIVIVGTVSTKGVVDLNQYKKPTIAVGIYDPEMQKIPFNPNGTSGIVNFSYILNSKDFDKEVTHLQELFEFKDLVILLNENISKVFNSQESSKEIESVQNKLNIKITPVLLGTDIKSSIDKIPTGTDAVYLLASYEYEQHEIKEMADYLIDKKLLSFSVSNLYTQLGFLASMSSDNEMEKVIRKVAVMVDGVVNGEKLSEMKVAINQKNELYFNYTTSRHIGYSPSFRVAFTANIIDSDGPQDLPVFSAHQILERAFKENLNIKLSQLDLAAAQQDIKEAWSNFLPDVDVSATGNMIDENRSSPVTGQAEKTISVGASATQLLYSENAIANIKIQKYLEQAQKSATDQEILDIALESLTAYFNILQAKTNVSIQDENFSLSKKNLELSRLRVAVGTASNADVYRWESEVANAKQALIEARTNQHLAKSYLNIILNNTLPKEFNVKEAKMNEDLFKNFPPNRLDTFITHPQQFELVIDFLTGEAKRNHPAKKQLLANSQLVDRQLLMSQRAYYLPTVAMQAQVDEVAWRGGIGSEPLPGNSFNDRTWNVGLNISYPLFDGNRRHINVQKAKIQQKQMNMQMQNLDLNLGFNIQSKAVGVLQATTNLNYSKISSENAVENLKLVQNSYKQGATSLISLLDAQKAAIQAKLGHANSIYNYLLGLFELQSSVGHLDILKSNEENNAFNERLNQFMIENNLQ